MATDDFFRARLDQMIDLRHPLAVLCRRMPWSQIEAALSPAFARKNIEGKVIDQDDLFGGTLETAGVPARIVWTRFCNSGCLSDGISLASFEG